MISDLTPTLSCADSLWFGGGGLFFFFIPNHFACNQLQLCQQCTKWEKSGVRRGGRIFLAVCQKEMSNLAAFVYVCFRKTNPVLDTIFDSIYYSQPASRFERLGTTEATNGRLWEPAASFPALPALLSRRRREPQRHAHSDRAPPKVNQATC